MAYLIRVQLPDKPGSLGSLAVALGSIGADIESFEVIERSAGYVVDDLIINLHPTSLPDNIISAAEKLPDVIVDSIRPHSGTRDFLHELELINLISTYPEDGWNILMERIAPVLRVTWACIAHQSPPYSPTPTVQVLLSSPGAPEAMPTSIKPWPVSTVIGYPENAPWIPPMWQELETALAAAPLNHHNCILLIGRIGGPELRASEITRLGYLCRILTLILPPLTLSP